MLFFSKLSNSSEIFFCICLESSSNSMHFCLVTMNEVMTLISIPPSVMSSRASNSMI